MTLFILFPFPVLLFLAALIPAAHPLGGSSATIAVVYGSAPTICSIAAGRPTQPVQCWSWTHAKLLRPDFANISFDAVAGGRDVFCGIRSGGFSLLCWNANFTTKRIYYNASAPLTSLAIGDTQICALENTTIGGSGNAICWRGDRLPPAQFQNSRFRFRSISSGLRFSCGILTPNRTVSCWGDDGYASRIQTAFVNVSMVNIQVGGSHACGIDELGFVLCKGDNSHGQLNVPSNSPYEYRNLALGENHSCAIRRVNHTVVCWGGNGEFSSSSVGDISFESIVAGVNFTCGLITTNFSVVCFGPGWPNEDGIALPLQKTLPGPCLDTFCECNLYPESISLCGGNGHVCRPCDDDHIPIEIPSPDAGVIINSKSRRLGKGLLAFAVVGSVGGFAGLCSLLYCLWIGVGKKKVHNSVQPTIAGSCNMVGSNPMSRSSTIRRQGSILMRRQRSGTSASTRADGAEEFLFSDLAVATGNFAVENKIGAGSFGAVYKGKLHDGREVAIKRCELGPKTKRFQEKESAFESEIAFLSRLNHKHLVGLFGYCEENEERLLVYEYMKHGALYDHLHDKNNVQKISSIVNSWKIRIKISLDAARGIEYLHTYAVPPIIHRDIKSSNILLDANWTARVSDFGLSLMWPEDDRGYRPMKAAGTVGYIDPEYYGLNVVTTKSDVYGLGVVLLELLTGKRAIFKESNNGGKPVSLVDYAVPPIMAGELSGILDAQVGPPDQATESEAVELVAHTAIHCVHLEGKDRPSMTDIVANLERAWALCGESQGSISGGSRNSIVSDRS